MALRKIHDGDPNDPVLDLIEMPWGFRLRPANIENRLSDAIIEWALTAIGISLLLVAFGQWILPGSLFGQDALMMRFILTCVLGLAGGLTLSASARGFRPEVQVDKRRQEIRFVSRNPRGRGEILATVEIERIIGVGITRSIDGPDCHCLIYLIDGRKPLRLATGTENEIRAIRKRMDDYVVPAAERLAAKARARSAGGKLHKSQEKTAA